MSKPFGGASGPTAVTTAADADTLLIWRDANGDVRRITKANYLSGYQKGGITITGTGTLALSTFTLTVPATGTVGLLGTAQTFTALKTFSAGLTFGQDTLNYYDEDGNWTPTDASGGGLTFAADDAAYTRIGERVFIDCILQWPVTADTNATAISGLPFDPAQVDATNGAVYSCVVGFTDYGNPLTAIINSSSNQIWLYNYSATRLTNANMSGKRIRFSGSFAI